MTSFSKYTNACATLDISRSTALPISTKWFLIERILLSVISGMISGCASRNCSLSSRFTSDGRIACPEDVPCWSGNEIRMILQRGGKYSLPVSSIKEWICCRNRYRESRDRMHWCQAACRYAWANRMVRGTVHTTVQGVACCCHCWSAADARSRD